MFSIKAKKRDLKVKSESLRKSGAMPAVFYGAKQDSTPITVSTIDFKKVWREAGESSTVKIVMPEESKENKTEAKGDIDVLIHEVQTDPLSDEPIHADFLVIDMDRPIKVKVALDFVGVSNAVKSGLGTLVKVMHEVEVEALPKDLPHNLTVDISKLETLADNILVSDIKLPSGVTAVAGGEEVVASVVAQKEEKEEVPAEVDLSAIEVEKKGKKEEEGAEPGTEAPAKDEKTQEK